MFACLRKHQPILQNTCMGLSSQSDYKNVFFIALGFGLCMGKQEHFLEWQFLFPDG